MKRLAGVLPVVGAVLLGAVMVCGIAFQVFNGGEVPNAVWTVMSIVVGILFATVACIFIVMQVSELVEWWRSRGWFKE
jgi:formate/nitrite transporter FocA (FNT family)